MGDLPWQALFFAITIGAVSGAFGVGAIADLAERNYEREIE